MSEREMIFEGKEICFKSKLVGFYCNYMGDFLQYVLVPMYHLTGNKYVYQS